MTTCPTCAARAKTAPETLSDVLIWCAPPPSLLTALDGMVEKSPAPPSEEFTAWREKWRAINAGDPVPEIDQFERISPIPQIHT